MNVLFFSRDQHRTRHSSATSVTITLISRQLHRRFHQFPDSSVSLASLTPIHVTRKRQNSMTLEFYDWQTAQLSNTANPYLANAVNFMMVALIVHTSEKGPWMPRGKGEVFASPPQRVADWLVGWLVFLDSDYPLLQGTYARTWHCIHHLHLIYLYNGAGNTTWLVMPWWWHQGGWDGYGGIPTYLLDGGYCVGG